MVQGDVTSGEDVTRGKTAQPSLTLLWLVIGGCGFPLVHIALFSIVPVGLGGLLSVLLFPLLILASLLPAAHECICVVVLVVGLRC